MKYYRIHRGILNSHIPKLSCILAFLCHSIRDHDNYRRFAEVKQWLEENQIDHFFTVMPMDGDSTAGDVYSALVLNNDSDAILLRIRFDYAPGDSILFTKGDRHQTQNTWTVPES